MWTFNSFFLSLLSYFVTDSRFYFDTDYIMRCPGADVENKKFSLKRKMHCSTNITLKDSKAERIQLRRVETKSVT